MDGNDRYSRRRIHGHKTVGVNADSRGKTFCCQGKGIEANRNTRVDRTFLRFENFKCAESAFVQRIMFIFVIHRALFSLCFTNGRVENTIYSEQVVISDHLMNPLLGLHVWSRRQVQR